MTSLRWGLLSDCLSHRRNVLAALAAMGLVDVAYFAYFFFSYGYLPTPFIFDKTDTFMDFFHPMYWSDQEGRYSQWGSVYPPLTFLALSLVKGLFLGQSLFADAFALRASGTALQLFLGFSYLGIAAYVVARPEWQGYSRVDRWLAFTIAITSVPMLFALERGNIILFSLLLLPVAIYGSSSHRLVAMALLVNIKPYFAVLYFVYIAGRQWRQLMIALLMAAVFFAITGLALDREFGLFLGNLFSFSQNGDLFSPREVISFPSSVSAISYLLKSQGFQISSYSREYFAHELAWSSLLIETIKWGVIVSILVVMFRANSQYPARRSIAVLVVLVSNLGVSVGGYTLIFYLALIPVFYEMRFRRYYLLAVVAMLLPWDALPLASQLLPPQPVFLSGMTVPVQWILGLGSIVRPTINLFALAMMIKEMMIKLPEPSLLVEPQMKFEGGKLSMKESIFDAIRLYRRRIILAIGVGICGAVVASIATPKEWESMVTIQIGQFGVPAIQTAGAGNSSVSPIEIPAAALERMNSLAFIEAVARRMDRLDLIPQLLPNRLGGKGRVEFRPIPGTDLIVVRTRATSAEQAQAIGEAVLAELESEHAKIAEPFQKLINGFRDQILSKVKAGGATEDQFRLLMLLTDPISRPTRATVSVMTRPNAVFPSILYCVAVGFVAAVLAYFVSLFASLYGLGWPFGRSGSIRNE